MLEVRNISRIYRPKKGVPVKALDDVSLKFPEKGMVFILGKSGSGKSTLLNVLGGLDRCDKGEIIIKGKSSKDFSQNDFDSYRNTYLGFIFQEYNILNEFTVGANIGLALELQGKKATNKAINKILEEVDLVGYGNRKPTELSGGQKQRVAIARALVKNPEIILADEPTGALDSKTGIQVFETLKKLSKDKLVIVVTHDREYAEYYGDRVIEFKDGKVISDIEKYLAPSFRKNQHMSIVDDKIISIKKGYQLTPEDVALINHYIKNHNTIISIDDQANEDLRKFARIDLEGNKEAFKDTDESKIELSKDKSFKLIKSRLPWKNSFKIGASGLKSKPFRLVLTILLSVVAFTMAGLSDTMGAYDKYSTTTKSFVDSKINAYVMTKQKSIYNEEYDDYYVNDMNAIDDDIQRLNKETGLKFKGLYRPPYAYYDIKDYASEPSKVTYMYENLELNGFFEINEEDVDSLGFTYAGTLPQKDNEIAISQFVFNYFDNYGYRYNEINLKGDDISNIPSFLNKKPKLFFDNREFTITAVIDTQFDYEHFKLLNDNSQEIEPIVYFFLQDELRQTVSYGYHGMIFANSGYVSNLLANKDKSITLQNVNMSLNFDEFTSMYINNVLKLNDMPQDQIMFFGEPKSKLKSNEIILSVQAYMDYLHDLILYQNENYEAPWDLMPEWYEDYHNYHLSHEEFVEDYLLTVFIPNNYPRDFYVKEDFSVDYNGLKEYKKEDYTLEKMNALTDEEKYTVYWMYMMHQSNRNDWDIYTYDYLYNLKEQDNKANIIFDALKDGNFIEPTNQCGMNTPKMYYTNYPYFIYEQEMDYKIIGLYHSDRYSTMYRSEAPVILDDQLYTEISEVIGGDYMFLIAPMPTSESEIARLVRFGYDNSFDNGISYIMRNSVMATLEKVNSFIESLSQVFLYVGIGFAVFASLMLMNFITISINYKSKEIGILRAIGARSSDVFGIFFNESMIIAMINYVLAVIATLLGVMWLNAILRNQYQILITLLIFGIRQLILMLAISIGVAFISSFLPVMRIARKKPVDAMKK